MALFLSELKVEDDYITHSPQSTLSNHCYCYFSLLMKLAVDYGIVVFIMMMPSKSSLTPVPVVMTVIAAITTRDLELKTVSSSVGIFCLLLRFFQKTFCQLRLSFDFIFWRILVMTYG